MAKSKKAAFVFHETAPAEMSSAERERRTQAALEAFADMVFKAPRAAGAKQDLLPEESRLRVLHWAKDAADRL